MLKVTALAAPIEAIEANAKLFFAFRQAVGCIDRGVDDLASDAVAPKRRNPASLRSGAGEFRRST
jgi:hypothetical protein